MLTGLENFQRMMERRQPERLPLAIPCTPPILDLIQQKCGTRDVVAALGTDVDGVWTGPGQSAELWRSAVEALGVKVPANAEIEATGVMHVPPPPESVGKAYHFRIMLHPLSTITQVAQLERLPWPNIKSFSPEPLCRRLAEIHNRGLICEAYAECTLFEHAWYVRSMEALLMDLVEGNGIGDWLLDWYTSRSVAVCTAYAQAGVDVIALGDDVGTQRGMMMSVDFWRTHLKPRLAKVIQAIRKNQSRPVLVRYHSDGDIRAIIEDLIELGVDILNPMQPECMPVEAVIKQYQDRLAFWGMIGTQTTMPFGTPDDVRAQVALLARLARGGARLVVSPTHVLEPEVPWENILALVEAVHSTSL